MNTSHTSHTTWEGWTCRCTLCGATTIGYMLPAEHHPDAPKAMIAPRQVTAQQYADARAALGGKGCLENDGGSVTPRQQPFLSPSFRNTDGGS